MSDFKAKMHQIRFRLGHVAYSAPPDLLAALRGLTSKGGGRERGREGYGKKRGGNA